MSYCNRCDEYICTGTTCSCKMFELRIDQHHGDDDYQEVWALAEELAAEKLSEKKYTDDPGFPRQS